MSVKFNSLKFLSGFAVISGLALAVIEIVAGFPMGIFLNVVYMLIPLSLAVYLIFLQRSGRSFVLFRDMLLFFIIAGSGGFVILLFVETILNFNLRFVLLAIPCLFIFIAGILNGVNRKNRLLNSLWGTFAGVSVFIILFGYTYILVGFHNLISPPAIKNAGVLILRIFANPVRFRDIALRDSQFGEAYYFTYGETQTQSVDPVKLVLSEININASLNNNYAVYQWQLGFKKRLTETGVVRFIAELPPGGVLLDKKGAGLSRMDASEYFNQAVADKKTAIKISPLANGFAVIELFLPEGRTDLELQFVAPLFGRDTVLLPKIVSAGFNTKIAHSVKIKGDSPFALTDKKHIDIKTKTPYKGFKFSAPPPPLYVFDDEAIKFTYGNITPVSRKPVVLIDSTREVINAIRGIDFYGMGVETVIISTPYAVYTLEGEGGIKPGLNGLHKYGGVNSVAGLVYALDIASQREAPLVWICAGALTDTESISQIGNRLKFLPDITSVTALQLVKSDNPLLYLSELSPYIRNARYSNPLSNAVTGLIHKAQKYFPSFVSVPSNSVYLGGRYSSEVLIERGGGVISDPAVEAIYEASLVYSGIYEKGAPPPNHRERALNQNLIIYPSVAVYILK
jgi:hypothetical protein